MVKLHETQETTSKTTLMNEEMTDIATMTQNRSLYQLETD